VLIACLGCGTYGAIVGYPTSITQSGVTWSHVTNSSGHNNYYWDAEIWKGTNIQAGASSTITVNFNIDDQGYCYGDVCEYSGLSGSVDKTANSFYISSGSGLVVTGTTPTTSTANELCIGSCISSGSASTPTNEFTLRDGTTVAYLEKIVSSTGAYSSGITTSEVWKDGAGCIATFEASASPPSLPSGYSYIIDVSSPNYEMLNGTTQTVLYSSTNATKVFEYTIGNCSANYNIYVADGTYNLNGSITANGKSNITLVSDTAVLYVSNHMNAPAILLNSISPWEVDNFPNNWMIAGITINGNADNQDIQGNPFNFETQESGIVVGGNNNQIINCTVFNCRLYDIDSWGIWNTTVYNCSLYYAGSNSITLGGYNENIVNCNIYGSSDVGISIYGNGTKIHGNLIHDLNGTTGTGSNARYGFATEGSINAYVIFTNNTIFNCYSGVVLGSAPSLISNNSIINCNQGIVSNANNGNGNTITRNSITEWAIGSGYASGIFLQNSINDIVSFNILTSIKDSADNYGIMLLGAVNSSVCNNTIVLTGYGTSVWGDNGIFLFSGSNSSKIEENNIHSYYGIYVADSMSTSNKIASNILNTCVYSQIDDVGTGTVINPTSSPTYTLTLNNVFDGSAQGTFSYTNTTERILSTTGELYVNGEIKTSPYPVRMDHDVFAYVLGGSATNMIGTINIIFGVPQSEIYSIQGIYINNIVKIKGLP